MVRILFIVLGWMVAYPSFGLIQYNGKIKEQRERATDLPRWGKYKGDNSNSTWYRILRNGSQPGKYESIIPGTTLFVATMMVAASAKDSLYYECIVAVKGDYDLSQIKSGVYKTEDIISMQCGTRK